MKIIPLADRVVIKTVEVEETTKGGLILTGSAKEKPQVAEVVAVGPGGVVDGKEVKMTVKVGDKVQVRVVIKNNKDLDFLTVTDQRAACFEPKDQLSGSRYMDGTYFFQETKDAQTNLFFTSLDKGTHIISYDVYVTAEGHFSAGIATAQCQYAPQLSAHSSGTQITVQP